MTAAEPELLLLDTNVLVHLVRGNAIGVRLDKQFSLRERRHRPLVSIVTVGESMALGRQFGWGDSKLRALQELFRNVVVVDVSRPGIVERYSEIADFARRTGRALSDNDLWIAASAGIVGARLVTTDRDFDALDPKFIRHAWVDPDADA